MKTFDLGCPRTELRRELVAAVLAGRKTRDEAEGYETVEGWRPIVAIRSRPAET